MITKKFESTTYTIELEIKTTGIIDSTDVIGSLYKQLQDILKEQIHFQTLVREGKIGNISVKVKKDKSNSIAKCTIPTSLDKKTACLLAAKCEQITKIGHTKGEIKVINISKTQEDIETNVHSRAEELEKQFFSKNNKIEKNPKKNSNISKQTSNKNSDKTISKVIYRNVENEIIEIAPNCYTTKNIKESYSVNNSIILVEGRSDVKTLVYNKVYNIISTNGSHMNISALNKENWFKEKTLYALLDGDSSAQKINEQLQELYNIKSTVFAPKGKEISQLKPFQIKKLISKLYEESKSSKDNNKNTKDKGNDKNDEDKFNSMQKNTKEESLVDEPVEYFTKPQFFMIENYLNALKNTNRVVGFDEDFGVLFDDSISNIKKINFSNTHIILLDALFENSIYKLISKTPVKCIIGRGISKTNTNIRTISFEEFEKSVIE